MKVTCVCSSSHDPQGGVPPHVVIGSSRPSKYIVVSDKDFVNKKTKCNALGSTRDAPQMNHSPKLLTISEKSHKVSGAGFGFRNIQDD